MTTRWRTFRFWRATLVNLLSLQPGVVFTGATDTDTLALGSTAKMDNREGVVNGVRGNESNITVDGVDSNNWLNQGAFSSALPLTLDSVQEVRVITSNATPRWHRVRRTSVPGDQERFQRISRQRPLVLPQQRIYS